MRNIHSWKNWEQIELQIISWIEINWYITTNQLDTVYVKWIRQIKQIDDSNLSVNGTWKSTEQ